MKLEANIKQLRKDMEKYMRNINNKTMLFIIIGMVVTLIGIVYLIVNLKNKMNMLSNEDDFYYDEDDFYDDYYALDYEEHQE